MRIAVFADGSRHEGRSIARSLLASARALARRGHAVMLAIARDEDFDPFHPAVTPANIDGLTVLRLPSLPWGARWRWPAIPTGLAALRGRAWAPDVVHSQGPLGAGLEALATARLLRVPLIATRRDPIEHLPDDGPGSAMSPTPVALRYARWYYRQCDLVTSPSEAIITALRESGLGVPLRMVSDPLPLDPWPGVERSFDKKPRRGPGSFTLIHVGRLTAEQRVDQVIRAIPSLITRIPGVSFTVAGEGAAESSLRTLADQLQVTTHVRFVGPVPGAQLLDAYAASDVFVTMSGAETGGLDIIEAMAAGLPVIAARPRHLGDDLDASRSVLVEAGDIGALVESILTLHRDPARAATLGAAGRAQAARFSAGPIAAEWDEIYGEVLARSRQPRTATPRAVVPQSTAPPS